MTVEELKKFLENLLEESDDYEVVAIQPGGKRLRVYSAGVAHTPKQVCFATEEIK